MVSGALRLFNHCNLVGDGKYFINGKNVNVLLLTFGR
jgi:hypothetical protein